MPPVTNLEKVASSCVKHSYYILYYTPLLPAWACASHASPAKYARAPPPQRRRPPHLAAPPPPRRRPPH
ncbi:MAG: hypothetical protein ACK55Z_10260, partial [bacterium]